MTGNTLIDNGSANPCDAADMRERNRNRQIMVQPFPKEPLPNLDGIVLTGKTMGLTITGNATDNWGVAPPMNRGIREEATCMNNIICANNVNHTKRPDILVQGTNTISDVNLVIDKKPYRALTGNIQVFVPRIIEDFIRQNPS